MGETGMSPWFYIGTAYGVTVITFAVYWFRLRARRSAALHKLGEQGGES
jgi:hypothetical protein